MSHKTEISLGKNPGVEISLSANPYVKLHANKTEKTYIECIGDNLSHRDDINLALSGGIDSQFSLQCCLELNKNITLYTYRSYWEGMLINTEDVYLAEKLAKKYNLTQHIIDIDLSDFYNTLKHFKYSTKYFNASPQLSVHFYFIERLVNEFGIDHLMMGGDATILKYPNVKLLPTTKIRLAGESFYQDHMAPYYLFCDSLGIECMRDIGLHSPESVYANFRNNLDVLKNKNIYLEIDNTFQKNNVYAYKTEFYKNITPNIIPQVIGNTGFENLKKILAMETGVYNQFDVQYRFPQSDIVPEFISNRKNYEFYRSKIRNVQYSPHIQDIFKEFIDYIDKNDVQCVNKYSLDL
tara:strand:+ start:3907 stop:4962 length:1056 start_codon:yes stop_codon:yes gene_type:complete